MEEFYSYNTLCEPNRNAPRMRGSGPKAYLHFAKSSDQTKAALAKIPEYEQVLFTRIARVWYPENPRQGLLKINTDYRGCARCGLFKYRKKVVASRIIGNGDPQIAFVGQSPGANEDEQGWPFVGPSGQLLAEMLQKAQFSHPFLLTNIIACRPEDGPGTAQRNDPTTEESIACSQRLWEVLATVKPNVVVALGHIPAKMFWANPKQVSQNILYKIGENLYVAHTRHPAYHLRAMGRGGKFEMEEAQGFFAQLNHFIRKLHPFPMDQPWPFQRGNGYPFKYIKI